MKTEKIVNSIPDGLHIGRQKIMRNGKKVRILIRPYIVYSKGGGKEEKFKVVEWTR